jgi:ATP-dependent RNA helicase MRH4, mitochondrial
LDAIKPTLTHLVLCSATIPTALEAQLSTQFPGMQRIVAPKIHTAPRRIEFEMVLERDKLAALLSTLRSIQLSGSEPDKDVKRVIVFCNARETVRQVYDYLKAESEISARNGDPYYFELIPFTRENFDRHSAIERFNQPHPGDRHETLQSDVPARPAPSSDISARLEARKRVPKMLRVLITTDMASRGLDTIGAKNLVLFDIPFSSIDLLHRLGRTARAGTRGKATLLVSRNEYRGRTKLWVNEIRDRVIKGVALVMKI